MFKGLKYIFGARCIDNENRLFVRKRFLHKGYQLLTINDIHTEGFFSKKYVTYSKDFLEDLYHNSLVIIVLVGEFNTLDDIKKYCKNEYRIDVKL